MELCIVNQLVIRYRDFLFICRGTALELSIPDLLAQRFFLIGACKLAVSAARCVVRVYSGSIFNFYFIVCAGEHLRFYMHFVRQNAFAARFHVTDVRIHSLLGVRVCDVRIALAGMLVRRKIYLFALVCGISLVQLEAVRNVFNIRIQRRIRRCQIVMNFQIFQRIGIAAVCFDINLIGQRTAAGSICLIRAKRLFDLCVCLRRKCSGCRAVRIGLGICTCLIGNRAAALYADIFRLQLHAIRQCPRFVRIHAADIPHHDARILRVGSRRLRNRIVIRHSSAQIYRALFARIGFIRGVCRCFTGCNLRFCAGDADIRIYIRLIGCERVDNLYFRHRVIRCRRRQGINQIRFAVFFYIGRLTLENLKIAQPRIAVRFKIQMNRRIADGNLLCRLLFNLVLIGRGIIGKAAADLGMFSFLFFEEILCKRQINLPCLFINGNITDFIAFCIINRIGCNRCVLK